MAAPSFLLTLEDFHHLYAGGKPVCEYWQGEAVQKSMPTYLHALLQSLLAQLLMKVGWIAVPELTVRIGADIEVVPDVIATRNPVEEPYPTTPLELCIEIMSPEDRLVQLLAKSAKYMAWGCQCVWIIEPVQQIA